MRDIIFRGKRTDNGEWVEGVYYKQDEFYGVEREEHYIITSRCAIENDLGLEYYEVDPETVGQFTGFKDRNGKRIFEGDIIHTKEFNIMGVSRLAHNYEVVFKYGCFMLSKKRRTTHGVAVWHDIGEVIGNIHDNPELLEREATE